jgi:hypothetical protein
VKRLLIAFLPLPIFLVVALAIYLYGDQWDTLAELVVFFYMILSLSMVAFRILKRQYLRSLSWLLILGLMTFRGFGYESYHDIEYFLRSYAVIGTSRSCEAPAPPTTYFTVCYANIGDPWERFLMRGHLDEMAKPLDQWSEELKRALGANELTRDTLVCGYRRVRSLRSDYYYVEIACG